MCDELGGPCRCLAFSWCSVNRWTFLLHSFSYLSCHCTFLFPTHGRRTPSSSQRAHRSKSSQAQEAELFLYCYWHCCSSPSGTEGNMQRRSNLGPEQRAVLDDMWKERVFVWGRKGGKELSTSTSWEKKTTHKNILFHAPSTLLTRRQTFKFLSARKFFAGSDSSASSLCFQGDASASQQMNCSTVIASPTDWHSCLDIKICSFETSRHEDDLTRSVRRDCLGENPRKHTKAKHHIFPWNNNLMKPIKQQNRIHTGIPRSLADIWRRYAQMFFIFLPPNKNNPLSSFLTLRLVQNWFESPEKPSSPLASESRAQTEMEQTPTDVFLFCSQQLSRYSHLPFPGQVVS